MNTPRPTRPSGRGLQRELTGLESDDFGRAIKIPMPDPATNLRQALELMELGFAMQRQSLRRRHPDWTDKEVEEAFLHWVSRADEPVRWPFRLRRR